MTTRRRVMGALAAVGLVPGTALAQSTEYQCSSGRMDGKDRISASVEGAYKVVGKATGMFTRTIPAEDIKLGPGLHIYGDPPTGEVSFAYARPNPGDPMMRPSDVRIYLGTMRADMPTDQYSAPNVTASFIDRSGKLLAQHDARLTATTDNSIPPTKIVLELLKYESVFGVLDHKTHSAIEKLHDPILSGRGKLRVLFHEIGTAPDPKTAMAVLTMKPPKPKDMIKAINTELEPQITRMNAGQCPEKIVSPCFLTTASSYALGLSDDCWELQTLRRFRDGPLQKTVGGRMLIERYYDEAPAIIAALPVETNRAFWSRIWLFGVLPSAILCRLGLNRIALALYRRMFLNLQRRAL